MLTSSILEALVRVEHGFGTRFSSLSQVGMASANQIHSSRCLIACDAGSAGDCDALITDRQGLAVSVRTADCFPILMADPVRQTVAAIHAGWRGTAGRIVAETIGKMRDEFRTSPGDLVAAIGPGIGVCCYQVGEDVGRQFGLSGAGCVDLAKENRRQLIEAGVPESQIDVLKICTFCDSRFHSFRRDKDRAGRMISYIRLA